MVGYFGLVGVVMTFPMFIYQKPILHSSCYPILNLLSYDAFNTASVGFYTALYVVLGFHAIKMRRSVMEHKKFMCLAIIVSLTPAMYRICMIFAKYYIFFREMQVVPTVGEWLYWKEFAFLLMALYVAVPCLCKSWNPLLDYVFVRFRDCLDGRCVVTGRLVFGMMLISMHLLLVGHAIVRFVYYHFYVGYSECEFY